MLRKILRARPNSTTLLLGNHHEGLRDEVRRTAAWMLQDTRPARNIHPDYLELDITKGDNTDSVKSWLEAAHRKPFESDRIILAIIAIDLADHAAANATLKTTEQPPDNTTILLTATNLSRVLPTIISRAYRVITPTHHDTSPERLQEAQDFIETLRLAKGDSLLKSITTEDLPELIQDSLQTAKDTKTLSALIQHISLLQAHVNPQAVVLSLTRALHGARTT